VLRHTWAPDAVKSFATKYFNNPILMHNLNIQINPKMTKIQAAAVIFFRPLKLKHGQLGQMKAKFGCKGCGFHNKR
jgi:hypothetical protein